MKIKSEHGVLYKYLGADDTGCSWEMLGALEADRIALANGFCWAEEVVKSFTGKEFEIDDNTRKIKEVSEDCI